MEEKDFKKKFFDRVLNFLQNTCNLLDIKFNVTYLEEDFSTIINVVLFYTGYSKIKDDDNKEEIYNFQMDIATETLKEFYKDLVKEIFDVKENEDIFFYRISDMNFNTSIFFSGDNYDGFNITYTDE